jgi:sec-independent protein translocase protein TatB
MFGVDFSELMVILVIALIVLGPERLPKVAHTLGMLWGRAQRYINGVKADIARDMAIEEMRQMQQRVQQEASNLEQSVKQVSQNVEQQAREFRSALAQPVPARPAAAAQPRPPEPQQVQLELPSSPDEQKKFPID